MGKTNKKHQEYKRIKSFLKKHKKEVKELILDIYKKNNWHISYVVLRIEWCDEIIYSPEGKDSWRPLIRLYINGISATTDYTGGANWVFWKFLDSKLNLNEFEFLEIPGFSGGGLPNYKKDECEIVIN